MKKTPVKMPLLNKKNAIVFGDSLFSNKGGVIQCLIMCGGKLQNGKVGGRATHCAVGEVYHTFVSNSLKSVLKKNPNNRRDDDYDDDGDLTENAVEKIADIAQLKDSSEQGREVFIYLMMNIVDDNDENVNIEFDDNECNSAYVERAEKVQQAWRKHIIPLLK